MNFSSELDTELMKKALAAARAFFGSTSPNPPVGAVIVDDEGQVLSIAAHEKAGGLHAEAKAIANLRQIGALENAHTIYVTLEPCNHTGRTPPCSKAILETPIRRVVISSPDPNPVAAGGASALRDHGLKVDFLETTREESAELIRPFSKWIKSGMPFVILKTAHRRDATVGLTAASMKPPTGVTTFTSLMSLKLVHELRKQSDAFFTSNQTIVNDLPEFTVRHVTDFPGKQRFLSIFDRSGKVDESYLELARTRGLIPRIASTFDEELSFLGKNGVHQVLVEGGPRFSHAILEAGIWDLHLKVIQGESPGLPDLIESVSRS